MEAACQPARKPGRLTPAGREAATLTRRPLPFLFVMCPECFSDVIFCGYRACYCSSSFPLPLPPLLSVPLLLMAFPGVPAGRAVVNGASEAVSARRASIPDAKPRLAATVPVAQPLSPWPALPASRQRPPGCKGQRRFANRASRRCGGSLLIACRVPHTRMSPCRRELIQPQPAALTVGVNEQPTNFYPEPGKILRSETGVSGRGSDACGEGSQTGEVHTTGIQQQVPAKRQNRGSRNSTGDVL